MKRQKPPSVRQRAVAIELKKLRQATGKTQVKVAEENGIKNTALARWENCESAPQAAAVEKLFRYYGVSDERLQTLIDFARFSNRRGLSPGIADVIPAWFEEFVLLEQDASEICESSLTIVPGLLQTEDYAREVLGNGVLGSDIEEHLQARMKRQDVFGRQPTPLNFWAIIHETAFLRRVGNRDIMREQISHLMAMAQRPNITILVIPSSQGAHHSMTRGFHILKFADALNFVIGYEECFSGAIYSDDPTKTQRYESAWNYLVSSALPEGKTLELLDTITDNHYA